MRLFRIAANGLCGDRLCMENGGYESGRFCGCNEFYELYIAIAEMVPEIPDDPLPETGWLSNGCLSHVEVMLWSAVIQGWRDKPEEDTQNGCRWLLIGIN